MFSDNNQEEEQWVEENNESQDEEYHNEEYDNMEDEEYWENENWEEEEEEYIPDIHVLPLDNTPLVWIYVPHIEDGWTSWGTTTAVPITDLFTDLSLFSGSG